MKKESNLRLSSKLMFLDINDKYCACYNKNAFKPVLLPLSFKEQYLNGEREINDCSDKLKQLLIKNYLAFEDIELSREELYLKIKNDFDDKNHTLNVRFVPSYNCDKNCSYCLIQDIRSKMKEHFDFDYLKNLKNLVEAYKEKNNNKLNKVSVTVIGGEPTLDRNWELTKQFLSELNNYFDEYSHVLVTNGYGVTPLLLHEFKNLGGNSVYLSYDLREGIKDKTEPESKSDFDKFKELSYLIVDNGVSLTLDFKCNKDSFINEDLKNLLDDLITKDSSINIVVSKIINHDEFDVLKSPQCQRYELVDLESENIIPVYNNFMNLYPYNFSYPQQFELMVYRCTTASMKSLVVFPNGKVSMCGKLYSSDPNKIPYIYDLRTNNNRLDVAKSFCQTILDDEECKECDYALICGGKCPFKKGKCDKERLNVELLLKIYKNNVLKNIK